MDSNIKLIRHGHGISHGILHMDLDKEESLDLEDQNANEEPKTWIMVEYI